MLMQLLQAMQGSSNPISVLQQAFGNNLMFGNAMNMVQGKNPAQLEQIARNLAKERGINIDDMLRQMNQM